MQSGRGKYNVQTGRRDGLVSLVSDVDLPALSISVSQSIAAFARKGFNPTDMVLLFGTQNLVSFCSSSKFITFFILRFCQWNY